MAPQLGWDAVHASSREVLQRNLDALLGHPNSYFNDDRQLGCVIQEAVEARMAADWVQGWDRLLAAAGLTEGRQLLASKNSEQIIVQPLREAKLTREQMIEKVSA